MTDWRPLKDLLFRRFDPWDGADWGKALALPFAIYGMAFLKIGVAPALAVWSWLFGLCFAGGIQIWRAAAVPDFGDPRRAAAAVAYGALPYALYIPYWDRLNTSQAYFIAFPPLAIWGLIALLIAIREKPLPQPPIIRAVSFAGAGLLYAILSLGALGGGAFLFYCIPGAVPALRFAFMILAAIALILGALLSWAAVSLVSNLREAPADPAPDV